MDMMNLGTAIGIIGASLAVGLACSGSGKGVGACGEVGATVLAEDPGKFSQVLILQIIPGTQGLYGLVAWFFALMQLGFFSGDMKPCAPSGRKKCPRASSWPSWWSSTPSSACWLPS